MLKREIELETGWSGGDFEWRARSCNMHNRGSNTENLFVRRDRSTKSFIALDRLGWLINAATDRFVETFAYLINISSSPYLIVTLAPPFP